MDIMPESSHIWDGYYFAGPAFIFNLFNIFQIFPELAEPSLFSGTVGKKMEYFFLTYSILTERYDVELLA